MTLKTLSGFVLGSHVSSTYPRGYAFGSWIACGLAGEAF